MSLSDSPSPPDLLPDPQPAPTAAQDKGAAPAATIPALRFHTRDETGSRAFDAWREGVRGTCHVEPCEHQGTDAFHMDTTSWHLGQIILGVAAYGARGQHRTARHIRGDHLDHYRLTLLTSGSARVVNEAGAFQIGAGQLLLTDMAQPESYATTRGGNVSVFIPRELLDEHFQRPEALHGLVARGPVATLLADHLRALAGTASQMDAQEGAGLVAPTVALIAAGLSPSAREHRPVVAAGEANLTRQACRYIELHLRDERLSPQDIAAALKMSRAALYRLFEPYGGVASFIKERRLEQIRQILEQPDERRSMSQLASEYGYKSAAHFSTAFRAHFGFSASDVRSQGAVAAAPAGTPPTGPGADHFGGWLRALR